MQLNTHKAGHVTLWFNLSAQAVFPLRPQTKAPWERNLLDHPCPSQISGPCSLSHCLPPHPPPLSLLSSSRFRYLTFLLASLVCLSSIQQDVGCLTAGSLLGLMPQYHRHLARGAGGGGRCSRRVCAVSTGPNCLQALAFEQPGLGQVEEMFPPCSLAVSFLARPSSPALQHLSSPKD